jgi:hypothetical protein
MKFWEALERAHWFQFITEKTLGPEGFLGFLITLSGWLFLTMLLPVAFAIAFAFGDRGPVGNVFFGEGRLPGKQLIAWFGGYATIVLGIGLILLHSCLEAGDTVFALMRDFTFHLIFTGLSASPALFFCSYTLIIAGLFVRRILYVTKGHHKNAIGPFIGDTIAVVILSVVAAITMGALFVFLIEGISKAVC